MKIITYSYKKDKNLFGVVIKDHVVNVHKLSNYKIPDNIMQYLDNINKYQPLLIKLLKNIELNDCIPLKNVKLNSPIKRPNSLRDAYAFRKHVESGRKSRGLKMIPEYDKFPVFYFSNHNSVVGPGEVLVETKHLEKLDFELEIAAIIGKRGKNIKVQEADKYIFGYTIMNDFSARSLQFEEMKLNLGPAKGKDFATALGPYIVTKDEIIKYLLITDTGEKYNLGMSAFVNEKLISHDNFKNIFWTFAQIISHISYGVEIFPGDVIGSGTCATGCFLELNQKNNVQKWLKNKDTIRLTITGLGSLVNTISLKHN